MGHAGQHPTFNLGTGRYFKMAQYSSKHFIPAAGAWMRALQVGAAICVVVLAGCATKATTGADSGNFISGGRGGTNGGTDVSKLSGRGGGRDGSTGVAGGSQGSGVGGDSVAGHGGNGTGGVAGAGSSSLSGDNGAARGQAGGIAGSNGRGVNGGAGGDYDGSGNGGVAGANGAGGVGSVAGAGGAAGRSATGAGGAGDGSAMGADGTGGDSMSGAGGVNGGVAGGANGVGGVAGGVAGGANGVGGAGVGGTDGMGGRRGTGIGGDDDMVVGMIDTPGDRAQVDEDVTPQTLGGMLPLTVGVDEEGQFDFDRAVLRPEVKDVLDALAVRLEGAQYDRLDIIGYTDRLGSDDYNQNLSERRAWAVARYLIDKGVPLSKMRVQGRGERNSVMMSTECAELERDDLITCLQRDRRVEIEASIRRAHVKVE